MKGGDRAGSGRPRGAKDKKPRKVTEAWAEAEKTRQMLADAQAEAEQTRKLIALAGQAKKKMYHEFLFRVANKDGKQVPLSIAEKKMLNDWASEMAKEMGIQSEPGVSEGLEPLEYMLRVMNDPKEPKDRRDRLAIAAAPFVHPRKGEGEGKKEGKAERAAEASKGKFKAGRAPLALVK